MPKVPEVNIGNAPRSAFPSGRQNIPVSPEDFGGLEAEALSRVGGQLEQTGLQALQVGGAAARRNQAREDEFNKKNEAEQDRLMRAKLAEIERVKEEEDIAVAGEAATRGDRAMREMQDGYLSLLGKNALGASSNWNENADKLEDSIMKNLDNDNQRVKFQSTFSKWRRAADNGIMVHERTQRKGWAISSAKGMLTSALENGVRSGTDPGKVKASESDVAVAVGLIGDLTGMEDVEMANLLRASMSDLHRNVIQGSIVDAPEAAMAHYEIHKEKIDPKYYEELEAKLNKNVHTKQVELEVDFIRNDHPEDYGTQIDTARALPIEISKDVVNRLKEEHATDKQIAAESEQVVMNETVVNLKKAGTEKEARKVIAKLETQEQISQANNVSNILYKPEVAANVVTDKVAKDEAYKAIDAAQRGGRALTTEQIFADNAGVVDSKGIDALIEYNKQGGILGDIRDSDVRAIYKSVTGKAFILDVGTYGDVFDYVRNSIQATGKSPGDVELTKLVRQAVRDGEKEGGGWGYGKNLTYLEAVEQGVSGTWLPDLEGNEAEDIRIILENTVDKYGKPVPVTKTSIREHLKYEVLKYPLPGEVQ